ncbi:MAG: carotenoid biosynthesis protein [Candidatus Tumulicola sp.]
MDIATPNRSLFPALIWWLILPLVAIAILTFGPALHINNDVDTILTLVAGFVFIVGHGAIALGWRNIIAFVVITFVISFASEAIGVATGLVFGPYHYTDLLGPKLLGVPPMIQVGYVGVGYASMIMGRIILGLRPIRGWMILAAAFVGAFIMVSWDVAMDPYQSTASGDWIWHTGGPYFGVPLHNYAGWFGTVFVFMLVYYVFAQYFPEEPRPASARDRTVLWSLPIFYYALTALAIVLTPIIGGVSLPYASPANYTGSLQALEGSLSLVALFVMGGPVIFSFFRLFANAHVEDSSAFP